MQKQGQNGSHSCSTRLQSIVKQAIDFAVEYGGIDGAHHKDWVIDQMVRLLARSDYDQVVKDACDGYDGPDTYSWDTGIAP